MATITGENLEWGDLPEGWMLVDPATATFTVTFDIISCEVETPEKPEKVKELPSTGIGTESNALGYAIASMAGLMLAAVALRMNAFKRN